MTSLHPKTHIGLVAGGNSLTLMSRDPQEGATLAAELQAGAHNGALVQAAPFGSPIRDDVVILAVHSGGGDHPAVPRAASRKNAGEYHQPTQPMRRQDAWPQESGFPPEHCFVVEDASSGLLLTRAGEMAALRVARLNGQARLDEAVADLVVPSIDVAVNALSQCLRPW